MENQNQDNNQDTNQDTTQNQDTSSSAAEQTPELKAALDLIKESNATIAALNKEIADLKQANAKLAIQQSFSAPELPGWCLCPAAHPGTAHCAAVFPESGEPDDA